MSELFFIMEFMSELSHFAYVAHSQLSLCILHTWQKKCKPDTGALLCTLVREINILVKVQLIFSNNTNVTQPGKQN